MNTSFQISNMYESAVDAPPVPMNGDLELEQSLETRLILMEGAILSALQTINVGTDILSLNDDERVGCFGKMADREKLVVLDLLHMQYRPQIWEEMTKKRDDENVESSRIIAMLRFRDQFITLIHSVRAVIMNKMSESMTEFFCAEPKQYTLRSLALFQYDDDNDDHKEDTNDPSNRFGSNQPLQLSKIVQLFPRAEEISISGKNWDWSLHRFIQFLESYDLDAHGLALQYIDIEMDMNTAQELLLRDGARENIYKLRLMGWKFITPTRVHRFGLRPEPQMPFMRTFVDYDNSNGDGNESKQTEPQHIRRLTRNMFVSHSMKLLLHPTPGGDVDITKPVQGHCHADSAGTESSMFEIDEESEMKDDYDHIRTRNRDNTNSVASEGGIKIKEIDYDPSCCTLSEQIFDILGYKEPLIELLQWRQRHSGTEQMDDDEEDHMFAMDMISANESQRAHRKIGQRETRFISECERVESLVLDPLPADLRDIFYDDYHPMKQGRALISFETVIRIFPKVKALFLTSTTFQLRICLHFTRFIGVIQDDKRTLYLEKVYFSKSKKIQKRDIGSIQWRLREIGWEFVDSLQMIRKQNARHEKEH